MNALNPRNILRRVNEEGFENVWRESASLLPSRTETLDLFRTVRGVSHPLYDLIQRLRLSFLDMGFKEVFNPVIIDENEIYKQYGPEAPIILDRCYYLATLPRPDIGLGMLKSNELAKIGVKLNPAKILALQKVLRNYKKGDIDSDDLIEQMAKALKVPDTLAMRVISEVFPEFSSLQPISSTLTLRSHMTSAWFLTLQELQHKTELPIKLFSVDIRFRREQSEDLTHLRAHHSASCVVVDKALNVKDGEVVTRALLKPLGLEELRFIKKNVTSKYYSPGMEYEGFIFSPVSKKWIEVADYGIYSLIALARYDLEYPVLNVGVGVERLTMLLHNEDDVRRLIYPQFYVDLIISDIEMAKMVEFEREPKTKEGKEIKEQILAIALKYSDTPSPCEFLVYEGKLMGKNIEVFLFEKEKNAKLLGAAAQNHIFIYDGNIIGAPLRGMDDVSFVKETREKGTTTGIKYIDGIANFAAAKIEEAVRTKRERFNLWIRLARRPSDINIKISEVARRYITNKKKMIKISGPVFIGIRAEIATDPT